jgi:hypothetical protein
LIMTQDRRLGRKIWPRARLSRQIAQNHPRPVAHQAVAGRDRRFGARTTGRRSFSLPNADHEGGSVTVIVVWRAGTVPVLGKISDRGPNVGCAMP